MKKEFLVFIFLVTLFPSAILQGKGDKQNRIFVDVGIASSDFKGLFFDGGIEFALSKNIGVQVLADYYFNPFGKAEPEDINVTSYGLNIYFVYRIQTGKKLNLFGKAGGNFTSFKESIQYLSSSWSDYGIGVGCGFEYMFKPRLGIQGGMTFKYVFEKEENLRFFKFYVGVVYRLKPLPIW